MKFVNAPDGSPSKYTYFADGLGSVDRLLDTSEDTQVQYAYKPFGTVSVEMGSSNNPYMYTGREYNNTVDLHYYRARWMDSNVGRFVTKDLIRHINSYIYVKNNPINFLDLNGRSPTFLNLWFWNLSMGEEYTCICDDSNPCEVSAPEGSWTHSSFIDALEHETIHDNQYWCIFFSVSVSSFNASSCPASCSCEYEVTFQCCEYPKYDSYKNIPKYKENCDLYKGTTTKPGVCELVDSNEEDNSDENPLFFLYGHCMGGCF
ncbi:MAG: hypothetical protein A2161_00195 [Candidatus Schekmanbacteria bacterium RBG_13_48_7]|uniref:Uncharacterized protein n=1 Tax=Candidatus Schekmanbacteria bacterium RBG_13_48_7 TaxID=1817878 RepID=A0A1F7RY46_9BACT|nr:MAG: hypothetical protein A2161_00195 [Candidatus Schekmanbacteria bacterium RBG_13_48_7]